MVKAKLPFGPDAARKLMAVANHRLLSKREHVPVLPPSWGTLYELTKGRRDRADGWATLSP